MFIRLNIAPFKFAMINHPIPLPPFIRFIKYYAKIDLKTDKRTVLQKIVSYISLLLHKHGQ